MSIWCSGFDVVGFDWDEMLGDPAPDTPTGGQVRSYATGFSSHYPTTTGGYEQPAGISLDYMPAWCVPGHGGDMGDRLGPWLRLAVTSVKHDYHSEGAPTQEREQVKVVLDPEAARHLAAALLRWADSDLAYPTNPWREDP